MNEENIINKLVKLAQKAEKKGEVPIAAIIAKDNKIVSYAYNLKETKKCALYHAEILAIKKATKKMGDWRLNDCTMYTTLFPCPMCSSAIVQSRISKIVYFYDSNNKNDSLISNSILSKIKKTQININNNELLKFFKKIRK